MHCFSWIEVLCNWVLDWQSDNVRIYLMASLQDQVLSRSFMVDFRVIISFLLVESFHPCPPVELCRSLIWDQYLNWNLSHPLLMKRVDRRLFKPRKLVIPAYLPSVRPTYSQCLWEVNLSISLPLSHHEKNNHFGVGWPVSDWVIFGLLI